jgi:hypothetical protein
VEGCHPFVTTFASKLQAANLQAKLESHFVKIVGIIWPFSLNRCINLITVASG